MLDAGNTLVFLDMDAVAEIAGEAGVRVAPPRLSAVEGAAKRRYEARLDGGASHEVGWRLYVRTLLEEAGGVGDLDGAVDALRASHDRLNLWRRVPDDLFDALARARRAGLRLGVVSNSEGRLDTLFEHVGLADAFEVVVDSAIEGVRKPDPEIFRRALARMGVRAEEALYAGDIPRVDVEGAETAGMRAALIDPLGFFEDHPGARYPSVAALVDALSRSSG